MEDHSSPEIIAKRASQEDPLVMYLIMRSSLNMSIGKTAAQAAHGSQMLTLKYFDLEPLSPHIVIFTEWLDSSFRKVVLGADDKEWVKLKNEIEECNYIVVVDSGLTEIPSGSETCIAIWPMRRSQRPKILQRLQVLK